MAITGTRVPGINLPEGSFVPLAFVKGSGNHVAGTDPEELARPERFELPTNWFEASYSIQLSYVR